MSRACALCRHWNESHDDYRRGECGVTLPPWLTSFLEQLEPPYIVKQTHASASCDLFAQQETS